MRKFLVVWSLITILCQEELDTETVLPPVALLFCTHIFCFL